MGGLTMAGITDPGMVRDHNEDCYLIVPKKGLAILADGMGGHLAGEVASSLAVNVISRYLMDNLAQARKLRRNADGISAEARTVLKAVELANGTIYETSRGRQEFSGMGTTVVVAAFRASKLYVAHVGDSRLYRLRENTLSRLTEDHSMVQELLRQGLITPEEARTSSTRNLVTRALGVDATVRPDVQEYSVQTGDVYLLCSDGLNDVLTDGDIQRMLIDYGANLEETIQKMVMVVNAKGGPDNVSVVAIRADRPAVSQVKKARRKART